MKRLLLLLGSVFLCYSCQVEAVSSSSSATLESEMASSVSSSLPEQDDALRLLYASLSESNGLLSCDDGRAYAFYGEARENEKGEGVLTNGNQGVFSYHRAENGTVQIEGFLCPGRASSLYGFPAMLQGNANQFVAEGDGYVPAGFEAPPLMKGILGLFDPDIAANHIEDFKIRLSEGKAEFSYSYSLPSRVAEVERSIELTLIGRCYDETLCNYLTYPVEIEAPDSFDEDWRQTFLEWTLGEGIPFPYGVTYAFATQEQNGIYRWKQYGKDLTESYGSQLERKGYAKEDGVYRKSFVKEGQTKIVVVSVSEEDGITYGRIHAESSTVSSPNFVYVNQALSTLAVPFFPASTDVEETRLTTESESTTHVEVIFLAKELGIAYFEGPYFAEAEKAGYVWKSARLLSEGYMEATGNGFRIDIDRGTSAPLSGYPFRVLLRR